MSQHNQEKDREEVTDIISFASGNTTTQANKTVSKTEKTIFSLFFTAYYYT